jgi:ubiquinone biosynthesis protein COQ9
MRMIEYYELIHCWLNVTIKDRQYYAKKNLITSHFINECLFKIQSH